MLAERLVQQSRTRGELAVCDHDLHAFVSQDPQATAGRVLAGILGADYNFILPVAATVSKALIHELMGWNDAATASIH